MGSLELTCPVSLSPYGLGDIPFFYQACQQLFATAGTTVRCRVDFDTSVGDETFTTQKSSTDFTQQFVR